MSLGMRALSWYLRRTRKPLWADAERFRAHAHGPKADPQPPRALHQRHAVHERSILGFRHYSVTPRHGTDQAVVLYLHGGGYVNEMAPQHWQLVSRMTDAGLRVEVPLYGLAPQHHFAEAYAMLTTLYAELLERPGTQVLLAGDSAGGGLALGFAQTLAAQGLRSPHGLTLLSPWLDISCTNPAIDALEPLDPWLAKPGAILAGQLWSKGTDLLDPRVSRCTARCTRCRPWIFTSAHTTSSTPTCCCCSSACTAWVPMLPSASTSPSVLVPVMSIPCFR